jgi:hypothetical protein
VKQELHGQRSFAGAGIAVDQVDMVCRQAASKDVVQAFDARDNQ